MKSPSAPLAVCLTAAVLLGIGGYAAYRKFAALPEEVRQGEERSGVPVDRERMKMRHEELKRSLLAEFPSLQLEKRSVPDAENGFLQIQRLGKHPESYQFESGLLDGLSNCVKSRDSGKVREFLTKYPAFIAEAERIAALPSQSSMLPHQDYNGYFEAGSANALHDVLLLRARLAAESGDEFAALDATRKAMRIRNHLHDVEAPSLLTETVAIMLDISRMEWVTDGILPKLGSKADLGAWRKIMGGEDNPPSRFATVIRGEWHTSADHMFLPHVLLDHHQGNLSDPDETARVWSARAAWRIAELEKKPAIGFRDLNGSEGKPGSEALSKQGRAIVDNIDAGGASWSKGIIRALVISAQRDAVMDVLMSERDGRAIPELVDPVSGLPFRFDASTRMIHAPTWKGAPEDLPPLKLPW